ncbi:MAG: oxidative damage protection protein [Planctomycetota bacterium]|jgi:Fe-S cluster biosynthesis and repair protein YggX
MSDSVRTVQCKKLGKELPGLSKAPFRTELGEKIYNEISEPAFAEWREYAKKLLNEYRLNLAMPEAQTFLMEQCEAFLFQTPAGEPGKEFTPETADKNAAAARTGELG